MQFLVEIGFATGTEYYTNGETFHLGGNQYQDGILLDIEGFKRNVGVNGEYERGDITLYFTDLNRVLCQKNWLNVAINIKNTDGDILNIYNVYKIGNKNDRFYVIGVDSLQNINASDNYVIDIADFPQAPENNLGKPIAMVNGPSYNTSNPTIKAYKVNYSDTLNYLFYSSDDVNYKKMELVRVMSGETDITSSILPTFTYVVITPRVGDNKVVWLGYYNGTEDYLLFSVTQDSDSFTSSWTLTIHNYLSVYAQRYGIPISYPDGLFAYTESKCYFIGQIDECLAKLQYVYQSNLNANYFLEDLYNSTLILSTVNKNNGISFKYFEYDELTPIKYLTDETFINISWYTDIENINNNTIFNFNYNPDTDKYEFQDTFITPDLYASQDMYSTQSRKEINLRWVTDRQTAFIVAKHHYLRTRQPGTIISFISKIDDFGYDMTPGDIISVTSSETNRLGATKYMIKNVEYQYDSNTVSGEMLDIQNWDSCIDQNCLLLIHSYSASNFFYNCAANSDCNIESYQITPLDANGYTRHEENANGIYGFMIHGNGALSEKYIRVADPDPADIIHYPFGSLPDLAPSYLQRNKFDMLQFTNYSVSFFFIIDNLQSGAVVFTEASDPSLAGTKWSCYYATATSIWGFVLQYGGVNKISVTTPWSNPTGVKHHYYWVKKGNIFAMYIDGVQKTYTSYSGTDNIRGEWTAMQNLSGTKYLDGWIEEIRIGKDDIMNCSPNVGKTDTFEVPWKGFTNGNIDGTGSIIPNNYLSTLSGNSLVTLSGQKLIAK